MSIQRSAELLRQAVPWMARQQAGLHPVSYAVWFDYVAQTNPALSAAIDEHLAREGALDEFATQALFKRHVADVDPETAQRVVDQIQRVLGGIGDSAGAAGAHAARYSASLARLAITLVQGDTVRGIGAGADPGVARNGPAPRMLADVVAEVIADTGTMRSQIGDLQQRLADSRREIERLRDQVRSAREESLRDALTGLSNRRAFDQALAACLARPAQSAAAAEGRGPWLLVSDVDRFGPINEAYGRDFGDRVLKAVADAMRLLVPAGATLARMGGEAFALLVPELDSGAALALAQELRARIGSARIRRPDQDETERVTLSVGLAAAHPGEPPQALMERAGAALRQAKLAGHDRVV
ncbi:MAG: diguanylate cyclase [Burkholderiales bacterium]|nr:diguanylate cyclase [Burkholderiales bacterium]